MNNEFNKIPLLCLGNKPYILHNGYNELALGY